MSKTAELIAPVESDDRPTTAAVAAASQADDELLVEEISIDGMCGVY